MGQLIQGKSCMAAPSEADVPFKLFIELGFMLSGQNTNILAPYEEFAFFYFLDLRKKHTKELDEWLVIFKDKKTLEEKKSWITEIESNLLHQDLIQEITYLWDSEIIPLENIDQLKFVVKDKYFPKNDGYYEYDEIVRVLSFVELKINNELSGNINLSNYSKDIIAISAAITEENDFTYKTYDGEVGPELMPFPFVNVTADPEFNLQVEKYNALPKVVYRAFDTFIYRKIGHILLHKKYFNSNKPNGTILTVDVLMEAVWYRDTTAIAPGEDSDLKISRRRIPVESIIIHHTATGGFASTVRGWALKRKITSIHYCIGKNGEIVKLGLDNWTMNQTGPSHWRRSNISVNDFSIGIEIIHENENFEFTKIQYSRLIQLIKNLKEKFNNSNITGSDGSILYNGFIVDKNIIGHCDIALNGTENSYHPGDGAYLGNKPRDPGLKFDWRILEEQRIGLYFSHEFTKKEFKEILLSYGLINNPESEVIKQLMAENPNEIITLERIYSLLDHKKFTDDTSSDPDKLKLFIPLNSYGSASDAVKGLYKKLSNIGYFCGVVPRNVDDFTYPKISNAMRMFQVHFHCHIFPPEENGYEMNANFSETETSKYPIRLIIGKNKQNEDIVIYVDKNYYLIKFENKYESHIYTISIFIIHALLREDDHNNPF